MTDPDTPAFRDPVPAECDALVAGAGPAGLTAAWHLAKAGLSVVLLDKRDPWREPVACAEAVRLSTFRKLSPLPVDPWVRTPIEHCLFSTGRKSFTWSSASEGAIIDRARMHRDLAIACVREGALCNVRARVLSAGPLLDDRREVEVDVDGIRQSVRARIVVDATGPGRGLARDERVSSGDSDLETAAFTMVEGLEFDPKTIQLWYGSEFAPGGYAWLFPSGDGRANVGVVCARDSGLSSREGLARYLQILKPGIQQGQTWGGAIPCGGASGPLATDMLFKAGDAASMVHPLARSGILEAMEAGTLAAKHALEALHRGPAGRQLLYAGFRLRWFLRRGFTYGLASRIKPLVNRVPDRAWDELFALLGAGGQTSRTWPYTIWQAIRILVPAVYRNK